MRQRDRQIIRLALPSIISNITVPLLGLVDVAIVGHMGSALYIGAISVGAMVFNILYWVFGFLRMGTSGMTSQALGKRDLPTVVQLLGQAVAVGLAVALTIIVAQEPIRQIAFLIVGPEEDIASLTTTYFRICVWGAPPTLVLYALTGWYIGMQNTRFPMMISILQNVVNILASLFFVYVCGMKVEGVALGTVVAQYAGALLSLSLLFVAYRRLYKYLVWKGMFEIRKMLRFFKVNSDIFFRTICLVAVNLYFLAAGARQGALILAANTILMQLYILFSYVLDGFAFAAEALCGKFYGAQHREAFHETVKRVFVWSMVIALSFTVLYIVAGQWFLSILTDEQEVVGVASHYFPWAVAVPLVAVTALVWDGVFIGITASRGMLVSSVLAMVVFFAVYIADKGCMGNHGLWMAFLFFLATRGCVQTVIFFRKLI